MLPRLELVTQHLSPDEGKTRKETVSPAFQGRDKNSREVSDTKRGSSCPQLPTDSTFEATDLCPVSGVRQASASTCDSESSEAKKQAASEGQSLSLKSSIAAPVITSIVDTCLSHRGHKTQQWMTDKQSRREHQWIRLFPVW